jgi:hypothetical protein
MPTLHKLTFDSRLNKPLKCSICDGPIEREPLTGWAGGHNAAPVNDGRCCSDCNWTVVIPTRLARIYAPVKQ